MRSVVVLLAFLLIPFPLLGMEADLPKDEETKTEDSSKGEKPREDEEKKAKDQARVC